MTDGNKDTPQPGGRHRRTRTAPWTATTASGDRQPDINGFTRTEYPPLDPPIYDAVRRAIEGERAARVPEDPIVQESALLGKRLRKAKDPYGKLGTKPYETVAQYKIKMLLREMEPGQKLEITLGERARKYISKMPSGAEIPESVLTIYGAKDGSWYVDLMPDEPNKPIRSSKLDVSDIQLTPEQEASIPRKMELVKTEDKVSPGLIDYIREELTTARGRLVTPREVAATVGDVMHILADSNWGRYFHDPSTGDISDYDTEFELPSGRRPDVYDQETGRIGEYCTPNQAMRKLVRAAICAHEIGPGTKATVYLYDPNTEYWRQNASAWN